MGDSDSIILVVDYEKICRLCLQTTSAMSDVFINNHEETPLRQVIFRATGLEITSDDGYPSKICHRCRYVVELACEMRDMVLKTQSLLMNSGNNPNLTPSQDRKASKEVLLDDTSPRKTQIEPTNATFFSNDKLVEENGILKVIGDDPDNATKGVIKEYVPIKELKTQNTQIDRETAKLQTPKVRKASPKHLTCQVCLLTFPSAADVTAHVDGHYAGSGLTPYLKLQRPFKCEACRRQMNKTQLVRHHRRHLGVNPFTCKHPGCCFAGRNQDSLRHHMVVHGARTQVCAACGAAFRRRWELRVHTLRAHCPAAAHCRACRKRFRNVITYRAHMRTVHRPPRYACEWAGCGKAYPTPGTLAAHARTHTDERAYTCHLCAAAKYTSQSLLNRHLRMHERSRMSKCDKCAATFDDYGAFYRHRVAQHGPWKPHRCAGCNKGYQTEENLLKHVEACEQAVRMRALSGELATSAEENMKKGLQLEAVELDRFKGQSLLVQPGNLADLSKGLELHELPPDGLLYIEVDSDMEEERINDDWQE